MRNLLVGIGGEEVREGDKEEEAGTRGKKGSTFSSYRQSHGPPSSPSPSSFPHQVPQSDAGISEAGRGARGVEARVVMYKEMNHLQSLVAIMRDSKYSDLIAKEIEGFVWGV